MVAGSGTKRPIVKRGGRQTASGYLFELNAGALCLDLANTVDKRPVEGRRELLRDYRAFVDWGVQAGAITPEQGATLRAAAERRPAGAARTLRHARETREAIFGLFSSIAHGGPIDAHALQIFNRALSVAMGHLRVDGRGRELALGWDDSDPRLERIIWPALKSAAELLTSPKRLRARVCAAPDCDWLFLDQSKNGTRRWCDMTVCGNRAKAKRFYRRHHESAAPAGRSRARKT